MKIKKSITILIKKALKGLDLPHTEIDIEHPVDLSHGDYATNVAMKLAKTSGGDPVELATRITEKINATAPIWLQSASVAGPGFINISLSRDFFTETMGAIDEEFGRNTQLSGKKTIVEYTDPNPFKVLHIGHLMSNTIGESLSRIIEWSGAETMRACYQGDVGMHVAQSIWGLMKLGLENIPYDADLSMQTAYLGKAYVHGATAYKDVGSADAEEIKSFNKQIYDQSNPTINELYSWGKKVSLAYFETQYKKLGTQHDPNNQRGFNYYFFESETGPAGKKLVEEYLGRDVFIKSEGATVFPGEKYGLHTRVFINSEGIPVYEAKELALAKIKHDSYPYDLSVVVTGNEISEYFKVLLKAMSIVYPELEEKTVHIGHGMLRLPSGKMSSRTGKLIAAEDLLNEIGSKVAKREDAVMDEKTISAIAVAALKYSILKQAAGKDIIFSFETSLSFEGDSGPYLQYTFVRAQAVLAKAKQLGLEPSFATPSQWQSTEMERFIYRFPEIVEKSLAEYSPHYIATFLTELARMFNSWYGNTKIVNVEDQASGYRLALTKAVAQTIHNGLWLLGIETPERM